MSNADALAAFIAKNGVTKCPSADASAVKEASRAYYFRAGLVIV